MKYPISIVGLTIMAMAVFAGFAPTLPSILLLFVTTLLGGRLIRKHHEKEVYDNFVRKFGYGVVLFNLAAAGLIMLTPLNYIDKASAAFLSIMVAVVILTLIRNNKQ